MKVALITLHHVRNMGSLLQTYASIDILKKLGHSVEVIDFIPKGLTLCEGIKTIKKSPNILWNTIRYMGAALVFSIRQIVMIKFLQKFVPLSSKTYKTYLELKQNPPEADVYVCGSDQIWNTQNSNAEDDINAYYLAFVPAHKKKISYSSSIGKTEFSEIEAQWVQQELKSFSKISVRESHAVKLLNSIGVSNVVHVLDPTMLLTADDWRQCFELPQHDKKGYIFVYNLNRNWQLEETARMLAKEKNLKVVKFKDALGFKNGTRNFLYNTPIDFLHYLSNADYVLTDSFHGTVFSIIFNKIFVTFPVERFNSRIESLLKLFNLSDRLANGSGNFVTRIDSPINYAEVNKILVQEREKSLLFLKQAIQ